MQVYKAPIDDLRFVFEALDYPGRVAALADFADFDLDTVMEIAAQAGKFAAKELLPLNRIGDQQGVQWDPETKAVKTADGFPALLRKFRDNGFTGIAQPVEWGGGGGPHSLGLIFGELATSTNKSFSMCPGLTNGLIDALLAYGTDEQKQYYLPKLVTGEWSGTMCLTEPQCGTDLGLVATRAEPTADGDGYLLTGNKIWITFGEHDMTDNIVHLVLARLPDAPEGIRGISTFVVPKFLEDGTRNPIFCTGLEHKLGIHASPTCVMSLEGARGWLVGEPHRGMKSMFVMMNHARLTVGQEGIAYGEIAYQTALAFAKDRRQSRSLDPKKQEVDQKADNILVHPDVRRMLLNVKASTEAMRALLFHVAMHLDASHHHPDEAERVRSSDLVALLTPVVKAWTTERGFLNVSEAMQVMGGSGYTTDWSVEQYLRDSRIAMIYEGTNHIQALDLVGRKLPMGGGRLMKTFAAEVTSFIKANADTPAMGEFLGPLKAASKELSELTMQLAMKGMADPEEAGAVASNYLTVFGLTAGAYMMARMAAYALTREDRQARAKLKTARYYLHNILPETKSLIAIIGAGKAHMMDFDADEL
ncbi:MAG: acyl-CoA dehydrogenase C-terminal domain-containing protein [Myxococcales bacterium]|nr:acyl-CoA dehydrogenase C-terminal domain-containing protein [Myxococcales bacterium]